MTMLDGENARELAIAMMKLTAEYQPEEVFSAMVMCVTEFIVQQPEETQNDAINVFASQIRKLLTVRQGQ